MTERHNVTRTLTATIAFFDPNQPAETWPEWVAESGREWTAYSRMFGKLIDVPRPLPAGPVVFCLFRYEDPDIKPVIKARWLPYYVVTRAEFDAENWKTSSIDSEAPWA